VIYWIDIGKGQIIAPQPTEYSFDGMPPKRIGDQAYIRLKGTFLRHPMIFKVILLPDASGRLWLVHCP
jgi:hypothetical protein